MADRPDIGDVREFNNALIEEFRANGGKVAGQFAGANLLLLTTTGARSGQPRVSPLAYFRIDGKLIIIGSFAGSPGTRPGCTTCGRIHGRAWRSAPKRVSRH